jgi:CotS family spore coat protein
MPHGAYCLKPTALSTGKLWALDEAMGLLVKHGFLQVAPPVPTKEGVPFVDVASQLYYLTEWFDGDQPDVKRTGRATAISLTLAELHRAAFGLTSRPELRDELGKWPERFKSRREEIGALRDEVSGVEGPSRFDQTFLKCADTLLDSADRAVDLLDVADYRALCDEAATEGRFCHGDPASRNFLEIAGDYFVIDFDSFLVDIQLFDLGRLIRRTMKHVRWNVDLAKQMVSAYSEVKPLSRAERRVLAAMLCFPQKPWRVLNRHYREAGDGEAKPSAEKLEALAGQLPAFTGFSKDIARWLIQGKTA